MAAGMRTITERATFVKANGSFHVNIQVREISTEEYETFIQSSVRSAHEAMMRVLESKNYNIAGVHHPRIGPIGVFFGNQSCGLHHLLRERQEAHERTPMSNPEPKEAIRQIAEAAVRGAAVYELPNSSPRTGNQRFNIVHGKHQIIIAPFWQNPSNGENALPTTVQPAWVITGYQMEARRQSDMDGWLKDPKSGIIFKRT